MLKEEFKKLTGIENISDDEYTNIEFLYEELGNLDKQEFCKMYKERDFDKLMQRAIGLACAKRECDNRRAAWKEYAEDMATYATLGETRKAQDRAYEIFDTSKIIKMKLEHGVQLSHDDIEYINDNLE